MVYRIRGNVSSLRRNDSILEVGDNGKEVISELEVSINNWILTLNNISLKLALIIRGN